MAGVTQEKDRVEVLDFLRAIASLAVCLHHLCSKLEPGIIFSATQYGYLGVQVFFVVSGFVIPYSLARGAYSLKFFPTFLLKRMIRLEPPYLVTLVVIIALGVLSWYLPFQQGPPFMVSTVQVLLHLGYVNVFFGYPWLSDVFWTLAIEFQYYLLMGLVFPLLFNQRGPVRRAAVASLVGLSFLLPAPAFVFYFLALFLMGSTVCQFRLGVIGGAECAVTLMVLLPCALAVTGPLSAGAAAFAVFVILFVAIRNRVFVFLGSISYSLYLIHSPIGKRSLNVLDRLVAPETQATRLMVAAAAVAISIGAAYVLYRLVERPAQRWSASFRYAKRGSEAAPKSVDEVEVLNPAL